MAGSTPPSTGNQPSSSHNSHSSPDNGDVYPSSPPLNEPAYDGDPFNDFDPYLAGLAEQQNSSDEQPDLPEDRSQSSPQPTTPYQLPSFPGIVELGAGEPDPFCQIAQLKQQYGRDGITQLMSAPRGQSRGVADDLLDDHDDAVISRVVRQQQDAANAPRTQASQYPSLSANPVSGNANRNPESSGYQELREPDETLPGIRAYAEDTPYGSYRNPLPTVRAPYGFVGRNAYADLQNARNRIDNAPQVNQQPHEGYMPVQDDEDDDEDEAEDEAEDEEESPEHEDTPTANRTTLRRRSGTTYTPRARGNRRHPPRSDAHLRFRTTDPEAIQDADHTHSIDRKHHSGRNLMALFDDSDTPRTRYRLRIEGGRTGSHASSAHRESNQEIPARLSLREICQRFPNHVWGTGLRLFMHEYITAEQIWKWLPDNVRMNGCKGRPHNYLQQAIGRQCDEMMLEETGKKRDVIKRKHDDDDDEDEDEEEKKPAKKGKLTHTPGGHQILAPARGPNQLPFPQRSPTSPFAAQPQQGRAGPYRGVQRPATINTPLPAARAPSPAAPSPPRTAQDLRRLINTELAIHQDHAYELLRAQRGEVPAAEAQQLLNIRRYNSDQNMINRVLQHYQLAGNPAPNGGVVGLMLWILSHRIGGVTGQAEILAEQDDNSVALNWYLAMLREVTQQYRDLAEADKRAKA